MDRTTGRALAKSTLEGLALFAKVFMSEPETFGGYDPIAVVHSKSLAMIQDARDDFASPCEVYVTIYLARSREPDAAGDDAREDTEERIDTLTRAAMRALWNAFYEEAKNLTIGPSETGYPTRPFDNTPFRVERFAIQFDDDAEE